MHEPQEINETIRVLKIAQSEALQLAENIEELLNFLPPDRAGIFFPDLSAFNKAYADLINHAKVNTGALLQVVSAKFAPTVKQPQEPENPEESGG